MTWLLRAIHRWRLRRARERHVYWKAYCEKLEALMRVDYSARSEWSRRSLMRAAGKAAKYEERVETLFREQP